jgi:hypothetical protein
VRVDAGRFDPDADLPGIAPDRREARDERASCALADAGTDRPDGLPPGRFPPYKAVMGSKISFIRHVGRRRDG